MTPEEASPGGGHFWTSGKEGGLCEWSMALTGWAWFVILAKFPCAAPGKSLSGKGVRDTPGHSLSPGISSVLGRGCGVPGNGHRARQTQVRRRRKRKDVPNTAGSQRRVRALGFPQDMAMSWAFGEVNIKSGLAGCVCQEGRKFRPGRAHVSMLVLCLRSVRVELENERDKIHNEERNRLSMDQRL